MSTDAPDPLICHDCNEDVPELFGSLCSRCFAKAERAVNEAAADDDCRRINVNTALPETKWRPLTPEEQRIEDAVQRATVGDRSILAEAHAIVDGARRLSYGHPRDNHQRTASMWAAYLGRPITPRDVCMLNALQKISRDAHRPGRDNLVDLAGWARNAELVEAQP